MKPLILMYHRIADAPNDHWGLAVSPIHFEEHLWILRRTRYPLPLAGFVRGLIAGTLPSNAVALTFDDGYVDNLTAGWPRLAAADVPATVFIATGYMDRFEPFWWDELADLILLEKSRRRFEVVIKGRLMAFDLGVELPAGEHEAVPADVLRVRQSVLEAIYQPLRHLDEVDRGAAMAVLRSILTGDGDMLPRPMTSEEVRTLARNGLVDIGAHTVTHPVLSELDLAACRREVAESKLACEDLVGAVSGFAYPFGEFTTETREVVRSADFAFACSTQRGSVVPGGDVFALPRVYVPDLDGDAFEQRIHSVLHVG